MVDALAICPSFSPSTALLSKFHLVPVSLSTNNKLLELSYDYAVCPFDGTRLGEPSLSKCQNPEGIIHDLISVTKEYLRYEEYVRLSPSRNLAACPNCRTPYFYSSLPSNLQNEFNKKRKSEECFIATAAMGSHLHPYVQSLRNFRDNMLLQSRHKTSFENLLTFYYRLSPPVARVEP